MYDRTMDAAHVLSKAGALIGDSSRATMLWSLMGGESRPASELAMLANVSPQTASNHLKLLVESGFVKVRALGRNKFYRLSDGTVAAALESLATAANGKTVSSGLAQQVSPELVFARTCYDHLAGELGVTILAYLQGTGYLEAHKRDYTLTASGEAFLRDLGVNLATAQAKRRRFAYACLDWSHRVPHLGGALGAALLEWLLGGGLVVRRKESRVLRITDRGRKHLQQAFAIRFARTGGALLRPNAAPSAAFERFQFIQSAGPVRA
jgi:DNA-binding transcriptional ArsR family regulator